MTKHNVSDDILSFYYIYLLWVFIHFVCVHIPGIHVEVKDNFWKLFFSFHLWVLVIKFQHVECRSSLARMLTEEASHCHSDNIF